LKGDVGYSCACDLWSAGCVLVEMLAGDPPFLATTELGLLTLISRLLLLLRAPFTPNGSSQSSLELVAQEGVTPPGASRKKRRRGCSYDSTDPEDPFETAFGAEDVRRSRDFETIDEQEAAGRRCLMVASSKLEADGLDLCSSLLSVNVGQRGTASSNLAHAFFVARQNEPSS